MIRFCDATLKRKLWLEAACEAFLDYQPPGAKVNRYVQADLADYAGRGISPADAAELYQAKRATNLTISFIARIIRGDEIANAGGA